MPVTTRQQRSRENLAGDAANGNAVTKRTKVQATAAGDDAIDKHQEYEFGGPFGVLAMMTFFPALFYYLFVCLYFYDGQSSTRAADLQRANNNRLTRSACRYSGKFATPLVPSTITGSGGWIDFVKTIVGLVREVRPSCDHAPSETRLSS